MRRTSTRALAFVAFAALAAVAACSSDSSTGPKSSVTTQQAYDLFTTVSQDTSRQASYGDLVTSGRLVAALGSPVGDVSVSVDGQSETFHAMALALRGDSAGVPLDSSLVVLGWRGDQANEMFLAEAYSDSGSTGYPLNDVTYVRDGQVFYTESGLSLSYAPASGSCTPATVSGDDFVALVQTLSYGCSGAKFSASFSGALTGDITTATVSFALSGFQGAHISLHEDGSVSANRVPARLGRLHF